LAAGGILACAVHADSIALACQACLLALLILTSQRREGEEAGRTLELKAANAKLEAALADTEVFLSCVPSILIGLDGEGRITRWNPAAATNLGLGDDALGRTLDKCGIQWMHPNMKAEADRWLRSANPSLRCKDIPYAKEDKVRVLGLEVHRIAARDHTTAFILTGADLTDRRSLEMELQQAQRLESVGQLAAGIAHEINTPIQYVGDNLRFLRDAYAARQPVISHYEQLRQAAGRGEINTSCLDALAEAIDTADMEYLKQEIPKAIAQSLDGAERVATIVRAMKEFAHPGRKEKAAADLNKALSNTLIVARNELKYVADIETQFGDLPPVVCHLADMNQVFLNLLINAAHAIADVVKETEKKGKITVRTWRQGDQAMISISDTGCGIPEAIRSKIFDPFFTTKPVGKGTGQGLAIARSIVVEKHGGNLSFAPDGTEGTTFLISLPIESEQHASVSPEPEPSRERVLG
jgi:signal transduction histidine kinase